MRHGLWIVVFASLLAACGPSSDEPPKSTRPASDFFVWADPGIASGNFDADYADCTAQVEKDPAITPDTPELVKVAAYLRCMTPKGWKAVNPDAPAQP